MLTPQVDIRQNELAALPEGLLHGMTSLLFFHAQALLKLSNVPAGFFQGMPQLELITFDGSTNLGAGEQLPDGLFRGLISLTILNLGECQIRNLPNVSDLAALVDFQVYAPTGGQWHMDEAESESKFDGLVSVDFANLESQALSRVPSVKNMRNLTSLWLAANRITTIYPGDFAGAPLLVSITLGGNGIVLMPC